MATKVTYLVHQEEVFALFPEIEADHSGNKQGYAHIGQHTAVSPEYVKECRLATKEEYERLHNELIQVGYNDLEVFNSTENDITANNLRLDLDCPFDKENNKIDVYSSVYWTAETEEEYKAHENLIHEYIKENELFRLNAWCDISGFDYWVVQQQEENYVSIDVVLKRPVETYTVEEIETIKKAIITADEYFQEKLL